jgi:hypothetical protein
MMGIGGSEFIAGNMENRVVAPLYEGWATASTSAGVSKDAMANTTTETMNSDRWALRSPRNVDVEAL